MNSRALKVLVTGLVLILMGPILEITDSFYLGISIGLIIEGTNAIVEVKKSR